MFLAKQIHAHMDYEVVGEIISVQKLIDNIYQTFNQTDKNRLIFNISSEVSYIKINEHYISSTLNIILQEILDNSLNYKVKISVKKKVNGDFSILILSKLFNNYQYEDVNDLLIGFVMELHNGSYVIKQTKDNYKITMNLPKYRLTNMLN